MGKKNKRRGVVWSSDPSTGSPLGHEVNEWDGISRTSKRSEKRAHIDERRELLRQAGALNDELYELSLTSAHQQMTSASQESAEESENQERILDLTLALERLTDFIDKMRRMKRSAARQRLVKHIYSSLEDEEWALLEKALEIVKEEQEPD